MSIKYTLKYISHMLPFLFKSYFCHYKKVKISPEPPVEELD